MKLEFGHKCKDIVSGKEGILVGRVGCITGCDLVMLRVDDDEKSFNLPTVIYVDEGIRPELQESCQHNEFDDLEEALYDYGVEVKDTLTEFVGKIINKAISITGDISYAITPKYSKDSRDNNASWYDESRLEVIEEKVAEIKVNEKRTGGIAKPNGMGSCR